MLATLDPTSVEAAYARLRGLIMDAELMPNTDHVAMALAERLFLEPEAIHAAAIRLQDEGLVSLNSVDGFRILPVDADELIATFAKVTAPEARAAYCAAAFGHSAIGIHALDDAISTMETALGYDDRNRWAYGNHHFHRSLVQCSGQTDLIAAALAPSELIHRARMMTLRLGPPPIESTANYAQLVAAIRRREPDEAAQLHSSHWQTIVMSTMRRLRTHGLDAA